MGHTWESHNEAEVDATVAEVWAAIATGPGLDSWFMGRNEVQAGTGGSVRTELGGFVMESEVTGSEPLRRFAYRSGDPDGRFIAFEYLIEGRDHGSTVLRLVANGFLPGDDWETEFEAMTKGGAMYFATLVGYLDHFAGRAGLPVTVSGPPIADWPRAWTSLRGALGLTEKPSVGDPVRFEVPGAAPVDGVVDFVNDQALGIRTGDALYRFVQGFFGSVVLGHHLFAADVDGAAATTAWDAWLAGLPA